MRTETEMQEWRTQQAEYIRLRDLIETKSRQVKFTVTEAFRVKLANRIKEWEAEQAELWEAMQPLPGWEERMLAPEIGLGE